MQATALTFLSSRLWEKYPKIPKNMEKLITNNG